jgi:4,4'-diaponeurosporenoate glycosyltransferase
MSVGTVEVLGFESSWIDVALFAVGWSLGWFLLWSARPLPPPGTGGRGPIAVVIPARDEAHALAHLLEPLMAQKREGDQIIVVDDHSSDGTAEVARSHGADVILPRPPPHGWLGKPNACFAGATTSTQETLVFLDADVRPGPHLLDELAGQVDSTPDALVSVQPWHCTGSAGEQVSVLANVTALMGCGAFTPFGQRTASNVAFGPVLAVRRSTYDSVGGHSNPAVRAHHTEDIALAQAIGDSRLFAGAPTSTTFRMYPGGLLDAVRGWTRSIATGATSTRWTFALATLAWMCSVAGGWIAIPVVYPLIALQVGILGRRTISVSPLAAALFPLLVVGFVAIFIRSGWAIAFGRSVAWKGRDVETRGR